MEYIASDRQTLLDVAVIALGSAAGVFSLAVRNGLSITDRLSDGQRITYELADVVSPKMRDAYEVRRLCPATDIEKGDYTELLYATGDAVRILRPGIDYPLEPIDGPGSAIDVPVTVDRLDEVLADLKAGRKPAPPKSEISLTRIFQNEFADTFA